jgi:conserved hypothetical phage tail region protein
MAFTIAINPSGARRDPFHAFKFVVEIQGIEIGGFSECSGLQAEVEVESYSEGGVNEYVHQFRGRTKYPPLILKHGLTTNDGLWLWHQAVILGVFTRLNGTIYLLDHQGIEVMGWNFKEAFPTKWTGPELRADSGNVAFESVELVHRGLSRAFLLK